MSAARDAALAVLSIAQRGDRVLDLVYDSLLDGVREGQDQDGPHGRTLVFGDDPQVRVGVTYGGLLTRLTVVITPEYEIDVEVLTPQPCLHLVVGGRPPLFLASSARGPSTLSIRRRGEPSVPPWRTAWLVM